MKLWETEERVKALATGIVRAQMGRVQLANQLLNVEPSLTDSEVALRWFLCRAAMEKAEKDRRPLVEESALEGWFIVSNMAGEYFDKACQSFIRDVCKSPLDLVRDRDAIKEGLKPFFESDASEREALLIPMFMELAANAMAMASATADLLRANLTEQEREKALAYASSLVRKEKGLDKFDAEATARFLHTTLVADYLPLKSRCSM